MISSLTRVLAPLICLACSLGQIYAVDALPENWRDDYVPEGDAHTSIEQHFRFNNGTEPATLDPQLMTGVPEGRLALAMFSGLVGLHPQTLQPVPDLAESWTISDDGLTYTFTLREGLTWSDNTPLTSESVVASWKRLLTPATAAEYAYQIFYVKNAQAFFKGQLPFEDVGIKNPNPRTLVVELAQVTPWFIELCAFQTLAPVPTHVIEQHGERWTRPEHIVTSGPFHLVDWKPRQHLVMEKSNTYWESDKVTLKKITALPYDDMNTALQVFRKGDMEWMPGVPVDQVQELRNDPDYFAMPYLGIYFYRFNVTHPALKKKEVRQALSMAIQRSVITENITQAGERPVSYFCPPMGNYTPKGGLEYDRDKARELLTQAEYPNGEGFPVLEILYNTSDSHKAIAENIAQQWREVLGINATARNREWQTYLADLRNLNFQVARSAWIGDYYDPNTFYDCFIKDGGNNRTGWSNAEYDKLLKQSKATIDPQERQEIYDRMEQILLVEDPAIVPLYHYVYKGMLKEQVLGFEHNPRDYHPFQYIWLEP